MSESRPADEATWLEVAASCSHATFFHTPHWTRIAIASQPTLRDASVMLARENGSRVVWPLLEVRRPRLGIGRVLVSTFAGCYGGPISDGPLSPTEVGELIRRAGLGATGQLHVTWNPFGPSADALPGLTVHQDFTHVLDLQPGPEAVERRFDHGPRGWVNRARREGVTVTQGTTPEDWAAYGVMYKEALARWGSTATSHHPPQLFAALQGLAQREPDLVRLWMARLNGEPLAGTIVFYWGGHAVSWQTARTQERPHRGSGPLLTSEVARDASERGMAMLDLNPSGGHEGTAAYKRQLGSRVIPVPVLTWRGSLLRAARATARRSG